MTGRHPVLQTKRRRALAVASLCAPVAGGLASWGQNAQTDTATDLSWKADLGAAQLGFNGTALAGAPAY